MNVISTTNECKGARQGYGLSPFLLNMYIEDTLINQV